jgi:hypothetical protein
MTVSNLAAHVSQDDVSIALTIDAHRSRAFFTAEFANLWQLG